MVDRWEGRTVERMLGSKEGLAASTPPQVRRLVLLRALWASE